MFRSLLNIGILERFPQFIGVKICKKKKLKKDLDMHFAANDQHNKVNRF